MGPRFQGFLAMRPATSINEDGWFVKLVMGDHHGEAGRSKCRRVLHRHVLCEGPSNNLTKEAFCIFVRRDSCGRLGPATWAQHWRDEFQLVVNDRFGCGSVRTEPSAFEFASTRAIVREKRRKCEIASFRCPRK